jgi:hypothetical protein
MHDIIATKFCKAGEYKVKEGLGQKVRLIFSSTMQNKCNTPPSHIEKISNPYRIGNL